MATQTRKQVAQASSVSLMTTELNAIATTGSATGASITNTVGTANLDGDPNGLLHLHLGAPQSGAWNSNSGFAFWWLRTENGVQETAPPSIAGGRPWDFYINIQGISGAHDCEIPVYVPPGTLVPFLFADTTGRTAAATGNTLSITLDTDTMQ